MNNTTLPLAFKDVRAGERLIASLRTDTVSTEPLLCGRCGRAVAAAAL